MNRRRALRRLQVSLAVLTCSSSSLHQKYQVFLQKRMEPSSSAAVPFTHSLRHSLHFTSSARLGYLLDGGGWPSKQNSLLPTGRLLSVPAPRLHNAVSPVQTLQGDFNFLHLKWKRLCHFNQTPVKPLQSEHSFCLIHLSSPNKTHFQQSCTVLYNWQVRKQKY